MAAHLREIKDNHYNKKKLNIFTVETTCQELS